MTMKVHAKVTVTNVEDVEKVVKAAQEVVRISKVLCDIFNIFCNHIFCSLKKFHLILSAFSQGSRGNISMGFYKEVRGEKTFAFIEEWETEQVSVDHVILYNLCLTLFLLFSRLSIKTLLETMCRTSSNNILLRFM